MHHRTLLEVESRGFGELGKGVGRFVYVAHLGYIFYSRPPVVKFSFQGKVILTTFVPGIDPIVAKEVVLRGVEERRWTSTLEAA